MTNKTQNLQTFFYVLIGCFLFFTGKGYAQKNRFNDIKIKAKSIEDQSKLDDKDIRELTEEEDVDAFFYEALKGFNKVYRFDEVTDEKNSNTIKNRLDLFYGRSPLLKKEWQTYYLWISIIILIIVGYTDFFKYQNSNNEQERDQNKLSPKTLVLKYSFIASVMLLPSAYTSAIVGINRMIVSPLNYIMSDVENPKNGKVIARRKIEPAKVYNYYSSIAYKDSEDFGFTTIYKNKDGKKIKESTVSLLLEKATINSYYGVVSFINFLQNVANFVLGAISNTMVYILAIFFPLVILLSYIPQFQGGIPSVLKYVVNFSLFPVVLKLLKTLTETVGAGNVRAKLMGLLDSPIHLTSSSQSVEILDIIKDNMSFSNLAIMIILLVMTMITPKVTDMLISGSQSGAFFSAVTGMATAAVTKGISLTKGGVKSTGAFITGAGGKGVSNNAEIGEKIMNVMGKGSIGVVKKGANALKNLAKGSYKNK